MKACTRCGVVHPLDNFHRSSTTRDKRVTWCKDCRRAYRKERYDADPEGAKQYARDWKARNRDRLPGYGRKHRHGITEAEYQSMVQEQDGLCAICGRDDGDLRVDHCHSRLVIRGLLCDRCNRGIGLLGDDSERLVRAAAYVNREGVMPHARDRS